MGRLLHLPPQVVLVLGVAGALVVSYSTFFARPAPAGERSERAVAPALTESAAELKGAPRASTAPAAPKASSAKPAGFLIASPQRGGALVVRSRPGGPVVVRLGARTEFGSPQTVAVVKRRGRWLGVVTTHLANGRLGWVDGEESPLRLAATRKSLELDLSKRRLVLRDGGRVLRRMTVGTGRPSSPTPTGRFAVTDKLRGARYGPYYGCCIIALSAHQPKLPAGWRAGDRVAVHGTNDPSSIGVPSSAGCPHAREADLRVLMRLVPLGTPVFIHP